MAGAPLHGTGSPLGVVTPSVIGQTYYDTTGKQSLDRHRPGSVQLGAAECMSALTDQLQNQAVCIDRCIPDGEKLAVLIGVFYQLYLNGTGGGGGLPTGNQNANTVLAGPTSGGNDMYD